MREASIEIETFDIFGFAKEFIEDRKLRAGSYHEIAEGISLRLEGGTIREGVDVPAILKFTLTIATNVALPIALNIAANWIYEKMKERRGKKIRVGNSEVQVTLEKIKEALLKEAKERPPRKEYLVSLSFTEFSKKELLLAARTLSQKPIVFNQKKLPYPDNMSYFGEYWKGNVEAIVYIRDETINELYERGKSLFAKAQIDDTYLPRLFFTKLILSSKPILNGCQMKQIGKEEGIPEWYY